MTKMKLGLRSAACAMADQASKPVKMNCFMNFRALECVLLKSDGGYFLSRGGGFPINR